MGQPKRLFVDGRYGQIHLRMGQPTVSSHPPLVCLHMFPQSGRNFARLIAELSIDRVVIAPDFPGYGESDPPPTPISASDYAGSVWDAVDACGLLDECGQVDLFGIHAGAKLAVEAAHQRVDDVSAMVLCSAAVLNSEELRVLRKSLAPIPLDAEGTRFQRLWQMLMRNRGPGMSYGMMAESLAEMIRGGEGYGWGHKAVFDFNASFPEVLQSLPHRITLINPNDDLYEQTPRTVSYLNNGELIDRPQWGHGFLESQAADVARCISKFLN